MNTLSLTKTSTIAPRLAATSPHASRITHHLPPPLPASPVTRPSHYSLRKGRAAWLLTFEGQDAVLKHEQGIYYVAFLLARPHSSPVHALDLVAQISATHTKHTGISEIIDPATGRVTSLENHARLQERGLALDHAETMRAVLRKQTELEALLEDDSEVEPVKEEAVRQLIALYDYEKTEGPRVRDNAQKASDAVGKAIKRLHRHLAIATDADGRPDTVLPTAPGPWYGRWTAPNQATVTHRQTLDFTKSSG